MVKEAESRFLRKRNRLSTNVMNGGKAAAVEMRDASVRCIGVIAATLKGEERREGTEEGGGGELREKTCVTVRKRSLIVGYMPEFYILKLVLNK